MEQGFIKITFVAEFFNVHNNTVHRLCDSGKIAGALWLSPRVRVIPVAEYEKLKTEGIPHYNDKKHRI